MDDLENINIIDEINIKNEKSNVIIIEDSLPHKLTVIPIKSKPLFPGLYSPFPVPAKYINEVQKAIDKNNGFLGLNLFIDENIDEDKEIKNTDIYKVGVVVKVFKKLNLPDGGINILINSISRYKIIRFNSTKPNIIVEPLYIKNDSIPKTEKKTQEMKAYIRALISEVKILSDSSPLFTEEMRLTMVNVDEPGKLADFVTSMLNIDREQQQEILETIDEYERIEKVLMLIEKEKTIMQLQKKIQGSINERMHKQQRHFFLKEQMKEIQKELGLNSDPRAKEIEKYKEMFSKLDVVEEVKNRISDEIEKLSMIDNHSPEYSVTRNYLETLFSLPWNNEAKEEIDISKTTRILNRDHYGLEDVKERIHEFLAVRQLNPNNKASILCFVGPPGVGKTSIGKSIAEALGRGFFRFSLGGMRDEAEIKGHRRTYIGAMPGKIIEALKIVKSKNPVIMLDEIDKLGVSYQGDPSSALLEALDPEQNIEFRDHYLDLPFDLSNVLFITTANTLDTIPRPLLDRMEIIRLSGYILEEKVKIATKYIIPRQLKKHGLNAKKVKITNEALKQIIQGYAREAGVRNFERSIEKICRKIATKHVVSKKKEMHNTVIDKKDLEKYLKKPRFSSDLTEKIDIAGLALGLAWTSLGGVTLTIESIAIPSEKSSGSINLTGQLGNVMMESAKIAYAYVRSIASNYDINQDFFEKSVINLHVPEGATPKDGPSAGITMATAILSLARNKPIRNDVAMTGELSLTGRVLPIGGLKEKVIAAKRLGFIKHIIIPYENKIDLDEIPSHIKNGIKFYPVTLVNDVFDIVFKEKNKAKNIKPSTNKK